MPSIINGVLISVFEFVNYLRVDAGTIGQADRTPNNTGGKKWRKQDSADDGEACNVRSQMNECASPIMNTSQ